MKNTKVFLIISICLAVLGLGCIGFGLFKYNPSEDIEISDIETEDVLDEEEDTEDVSSADNTDVTESSSDNNDIDLSNTMDMGTGSMYLVTSNGTSENGNIPFLYANPNDSAHQIGINTKNYDGRHLTYIYIDGVSHMSKRYSQTSENTLSLEGDNLKTGVHDVELIQYENDDPTGSVFSYHKAQYEVKPKQ